MTEKSTDAFHNITPLLGGNLAYRRQPLELTFDEKLGFGAEDLAFVQSAEKLGLSTLLSDQLYVYHNAQHDKCFLIALAYMAKHDLACKQGIHRVHFGRMYACSHLHQRHSRISIAQVYSF